MPVDRWLDVFRDRIGCAGADGGFGGEVLAADADDRGSRVRVRWADGRYDAYEVRPCEWALAAEPWVDECVLIRHLQWSESQSEVLTAIIVATDGTEYVIGRHGTRADQSRLIERLLLPQAPGPVALAEVLAFLSTSPDAILVEGAFGRPPLISFPAGQEIQAWLHPTRLSRDGDLVRLEFFFYAWRWEHPAVTEVRKGFVEVGPGREAFFDHFAFRDLPEIPMTRRMTRERVAELLATELYLEPDEALVGERLLTLRDVPVGVRPVWVKQAAAVGDLLTVLLAQDGTEYVLTAGLGRGSRALAERMLSAGEHQELADLLAFAQGEKLVDPEAPVMERIRAQVWPLRCTDAGLSFFTHRYAEQGEGFEVFRWTANVTEGCETLLVKQPFADLRPSSVKRHHPPARRPRPLTPEALPVADWVREVCWDRFLPVGRLTMMTRMERGLAETHWVQQVVTLDNDSWMLDETPIENTRLDSVIVRTVDGTDFVLGPGERADEAAELVLRVRSGGRLEELADVMLRGALPDVGAGLLVEGTDIDPPLEDIHPWGAQVREWAHPLRAARDGASLSIDFFSYHRTAEQEVALVRWSVRAQENLDDAPSASVTCHEVARLGDEIVVHDQPRVLRQASVSPPARRARRAAFDVPVRENYGLALQKVAWVDRLGVEKATGSTLSWYADIAAVHIRAHDGAEYLLGQYDSYEDEIRLVERVLLSTDQPHELEALAEALASGRNEDLVRAAPSEWRWQPPVGGRVHPLRHEREGPIVRLQFFSSRWYESCPPVGVVLKWFIQVGPDTPTVFERHALR
ncbi:hypothetical protein [Kineosporia babensis]